MAVWVELPAAAVIVTVLDPLGVVGPLLPHPASVAATPTDVAVKSINRNQLRRAFLPPKNHSIGAPNRTSARAMLRRLRRLSSIAAVVLTLVAIETVDVIAALFPVGVTLLGESVHVEFVGIPEHEREIAELKPPTGVIVTVV